jgi:hypothetical protein
MATIANSPVSAKPAEAPNVPQKKTRSWFTPITAAFMFLLMLVGVPAVSAVSFNLTVIEDVINAFIGLISPITNLIIAIVPLWFIIEILGFIMGLLVAILAMIKLGKK